jgi:amino acid adenylation domain-containing protein
LNSASVLHDIVDRARADPHHAAAADLDRELSYDELLHEAALLGAGLRARGVEEGDRVALLIPNSVDFVVAALGCLWIGAVFVPLAVTDPMSRLESLVSDSSPVLVITSSVNATERPPFLDETPLISMDHLRLSSNRVGPPIDARTRVAYMIYTSGTTGAPKGVQIGNDAFAAAIHSTTSALGLDAATRTLCVSPFHFDGAYANIFPTLISGGTVVIRPRDALLFPRTFFKTVASAEINYAGFTPSYLRLLLASRDIRSLKDSGVKMIALGGEALSAADVRALWSHAPAIRVFNRYGPTETTIAVTHVELTPEMLEDDVVTIGRPHPGVTFELVGERGQVVDGPGQIGELYVGGRQLMTGYWGDPALTLTAMHDNGRGEVMYRTGDLAYRQESGNYVYVDRADRVVKRSGVRISLVELGERLSTIDGVISAVSLTYDRDGEVGIVAFFTTTKDLSDVEIRRSARRLIPDNMIPDRIERVASMPLNRSNQLDEARLLSSAGLRPFRSGLI